MPSRARAALRTHAAGFLVVACVLTCSDAAGADARPDRRRVTRSFTEPIARSVVAASEAGVIREILVNEGDRVRAGDLLAKIDHDEILQSLRIAEARVESTAALDAAKARMDTLLAQKEAIESLAPGGHVNAYELQQKVTEYEAAVAEYRTAEDEQKLNSIEVDRIKAQLRRRHIVSPIDGFVTEIHKQLGEFVSASEPTFATIVRVDQLRVKFYLDERTLDTVSVGDTVSVDVGEGRRRVDAEVLFVSPIINADSNTGRLDVRMENDGLRVRSGSPCRWVGPTTPDSQRVAGATDKTTR